MAPACRLCLTALRHSKPLWENGRLLFPAAAALQKSKYFRAMSPRVATCKGDIDSHTPQGPSSRVWGLKSPRDPGRCPTPATRSEASQCWSTTTQLGSARCENLHSFPTPQPQAFTWYDTVTRPDIEIPAKDHILAQDLGVRKNPAPPNLLTGHLALHLCNWKRLTQDQKVLQIVTGYCIEFHSMPVQTHHPVTTCPWEEHVLMEEESSQHC